MNCNEIKSIVLYQHIRLDNNKVFYIGIGKKKRAYDKITRNKYWKNIVNKTQYEIQILKSDLTWNDACELEKILISHYGRKDLGTGILCNMTNGGEGRFNSRNSNESIEKTRLSHVGRIVSQETKLKMSKSSYKNKKVIDTITNIEYRSAKEVSDLFNINQNTLRCYLIGTRKNKTTFKYINND